MRTSDSDLLHDAGRRRRRSTRALLRLAMLVFAAGPALAAPEEPAGAEPADNAVLGVLPFLESEEPNRIYVDLAKHGSARQIRVMLDTGASVSVFTPLAARKIGVRARRDKLDPYRRGTSLGRDLLFYIDTRRSDTGSRTGWEYGLLGGSFLEKFVIELDFPGRRVRFIDPDRYAVPESVEAPGEAVLPIKVDTSRPGLEILVNGKPMIVALDTGAPSGVMLSGEFASAAGVSSRRVEGFSMAGAHLADMGTELGIASSLRVGPFEFEEVPVIVSPNGWFNAGYPGDSIIGYDVLAQFTIRIDYPRRRMWLRRVPDARMTFLGQDANQFLERLGLDDAGSRDAP